VITPFIKAPGNRNETILLKPALDSLSATAKNIGIDINHSIMSLDGGYS